MPKIQTLKYYLNFRFYKRYGLETETLLKWLSDQLTSPISYQTNNCKVKEFVCEQTQNCLPLEKVCAKYTMFQKSLPDNLSMEYKFPN